MPDSRPVSRGAWVAGVVVVAAYAAILASMRFHLCLNDFWAWSFLAQHSDLARAGSLQNGFIPPAYVLFLKALGPAAEIAGAFLLNLAAVVGSLLALVFLARRTGEQKAGWLAVVFLAVWPPFLQSALTAGPDIVAAALIAGAAALHWRVNRTARASLLAGALIGLALLVRGHALFAGLALVVAPVVLERRVDRSTGWILAGFSGGVLAQIALNLAAGAPAWETGQAFNLYKMVRGVNWYDPVRPESISVRALVVDDPGRFLWEWAGAFRRLGQWLLGPLLAWWWARRAGYPELGRMAGLGLIAGTLYCIPVSLGDSPRAAVTVGVVLLAPVAGLVATLRAQSLPRVSLLPLLLALVLAFGITESLREDGRFLGHNRRQARDFACVEDLLRDQGARSAREVFTDDFDLYFRALEGQRPLTRGGWGVIGIAGWTDAYPQLPTEDVASFLVACRQTGVRFLALTRKSRGLGSEFAKLRYDAVAAGAEPIGECGEFLVVAVPPQP